jgi:hypothetical protein
VCDDPLLQFTKEPGFLSGVDDRIAGPFRDLTRDQCAWKCLFEDGECRSFEYTAATSVCILVRANASSPGVKLEPVFGEQTALYSLIPLRANITALSPLLQPTSFSRVCSQTSLNDTQIPLAHDPILGLYFSNNAQLQHIELRRCDFIRGNLVVRCDVQETCRDQVGEMNNL